MPQIKFKMLNDKVGDIVEKLGKKAPEAPKLEDVELQKLSEAIDNTIGDITKELNLVKKALTEVIKTVQGEIARRGISKKVDNQISMFDFSDKLEMK